MNADVVIIGAGPAGIQAAIHASRKKVSVVMFGRIDGSAMHGTHVENYFGFIGMTEGDDMLEAGLEQAKSFGCIHRNCNVTSTEKIDGGFRISDEEGETVEILDVLRRGGFAVEKGHRPIQGNADHRTDQLGIVILHQGGIVLRRVRVPKGAGIVHSHGGQGSTAAADRPLQALFSAVRQNFR